MSHIPSVKLSLVGTGCSSGLTTMYESEGGCCEVKRGKVLEELMIEVNGKNH